MHFKCEENWYFYIVKIYCIFCVKKYRIFSLVTDTIYIFAVAKQGFFDKFGTGIFFKRLTRRLFVSHNTTHVVGLNIKHNDVTV